MKVSTSQPFQIIYSVFQHEYLGYLMESFVIQLDDRGRLSYLNQNISSKNAKEFASGLDDKDYELIRIMDSMQQEAVIKHFIKKQMKPAEFFAKYYHPEKGHKDIQEEIELYLERRRAQALELIQGRLLYEMGNDGSPAWKKIEVLPEKSTILFHFFRNENNTHYFPTIQYKGQKIEFTQKGGYVICKEPAYMVLEGKLYSFTKEMDGFKLLPFLKKKFIEVPAKVEDTYYRKFVAPLVATFDVHAKGFDIVTERHVPQATITFTELATTQKVLTLFGEEENGQQEDEEGKILFDLVFHYGNHRFRADHMNPINVSVEQTEKSYIFYRVLRDINKEKEVLGLMASWGIEFRNSRSTVEKSRAFEWLGKYSDELEKHNIRLIQSGKDGKRYFLGTSSIKIEIRENIDWFDIYAVVKFGDYEIPFNQLRKLIMKKQREIKLPNGEIAFIPDSWIQEYADLLHFSHEADGNDGLMLKKHHLSLVQELETSNLARVSMDRKLEQLRNFEQIDETPLPAHFKGDLRPYQKAGFDWMQFLNNYNFGGCLADDMGLGKTVQTLAMLQGQKEQNLGTSLLIMPTSLVYNWEKEAQKFTPQLKVFIYTGTQREKRVELFKNYDLVITSYGIVRLDIDILKEYYFNYIILDESQAIKNPDSNIARSVNFLKSRRKLILTGTPIENSTMDLWSQMNFANPGLLGSQSFFRNEYLNPIEKKGDEERVRKLYSIIKPFILRRHKSQVATELPEKIENIRYCGMTSAQAEVYEEVKSQYRNEILTHIEKEGLKGSQMLILQGLTKLRQIANHPQMVDQEYKGDSGKMEDVCHMLDSAISKGHKILVFSSFVKHLNLVRNYLNQKGTEFAYLDGSTQSQERQRQVGLFQEDDSLQVFLISLKAGGLGLNLTKADYVFILDPWWNPAAEAQAVDRAHRIGQVNTVFTYKFISRDTVEEKILALQQNKMKLATELISTEESFVKSLTKEDIKNLLD